MTDNEQRKIVRQCNYKRNWHIGFYRGRCEERRCYIQVRVTGGTCSVTGDTVDWRGAKHYVSQHMCKQEIVGLCFKACKDAEEHELREHFRYKGASIFNPHLDPDALAKVASKAKNFNVRENAMSMETPK